MHTPRGDGKRQGPSETRDVPCASLEQEVPRAPDLPLPTQEGGRWRPKKGDGHRQWTERRPWVCLGGRVSMRGADGVLGKEKAQK